MQNTCTVKEEKLSSMGRLFRTSGPVSVANGFKG